MKFRSALLGLFVLCQSVQARTPWMASRIVGSPEPPKPYVGQRVFTQKEFREVTEMATAKGSGRLFVMERAGPIWSFDPAVDNGQKELLVDIKSVCPRLAYNYGLAFHPRWQEMREVYVCYALGQGIEDGTKLSRFRLESLSPPRIDPTSEEVLLTWLSGGHNGANLQFGPDGYLYVSTGDADAPSPPDARNTGQDNSDFLSSILRIDVDHRDEGKLYAVPKDNPFLGKLDVRPEIWAFGFRNPWKMSFDRQGRLWCGDVGWELWEMVHLVKRGGNYGWSAVEATQPIKPETVSSLAPITPPVVAHSHTEAASITGGYVYEGKALPELKGAYLYGDYETGKIWALWHDGDKLVRHEEIADTAEKIVTFGLTGDGEILYAHWGNPSTIHRLVRNPAAVQPSQFPKKLSETGLFADVVKQTPETGVYDFDVSEPLWQKGTKARRFVALPGEEFVRTEIARNKAGTITSSKVTWPVGSVLARTVSALARGNKPVETQVLHFDGETWNGYSYRWNDEGSDAVLVGPNGEDGTVAGVPYRFHGRAECARCHTPWAGFALGFQPQQLKRVQDGNAEEKAVGLGLVDENFFAVSKARLVGSDNKGADLEARARSWLHGNCAHCHRQHGGGSVAIQLNIEKELGEMMLVGEKPTRGEFGIPEARVVAAGDPAHSVLIARMARSGSGHMPLIGCQEVDETGVNLLWQWIESLKDRTPMIEGPHPLPAEGKWTSVKEALSAGKISEVQLQSLLGNAVQALAVAQALRDEKIKLMQQVREAIITAGLNAKDVHVAALFEPLDPQRGRVPRLGLNPDVQTVLKMKGRVDLGREMLSPNGKLATCLACHFVQGTGRDFGPDLSAVGSRLTKEQLLESLLQPSKVIAPGYNVHVVTTRDGLSQSGFKVSEAEAEVVLKLATGQSLPIQRTQIRSIDTVPLSMMPDGLIQGLTYEEAADLLAYLTSLK